MRRLWFWLVEGTPTESGVPEYYVVHDSDSPRKWTCTCPHFVFRRKPCKHIEQCRGEEVHSLEELWLATRKEAADATQLLDGLLDLYKLGPARKAPLARRARPTVPELPDFSALRRALKG